METSNLRRELHVAQQSRRDKLRVLQHHTNPDQNVEIYANHLDQFSDHEGLNPELVHLRSFRYGNLSYEPTVFSSDMLHFAANSQALLPQKEVAIIHQESATTHTDKRIATGDASFSNLPHTIQSSINSSVKVSGDPQNCIAWKSIGARENSDWVPNYTSGSAGIDGNPNPVFVAEGLSGSLKANNSSASTVYMKPPNYGYQDLRSSLTGPSSEIPSHNSQKPYGEMHFYHNGFQEVTSATHVTHELGMSSHAQQNARETGRVSWSNSGNELVLLPAYADHSNPLRLNNACNAINRTVDGCHRWNSEIDYSEHNKAAGNGRGLGTIGNDYSNTQVLSLSLSSVPSSKQHVGQHEDRIASQELASGGGCYNSMPDLKVFKPDYTCFNVKPSYSGKVLENVDAAGNSAFAHRGAGPLGPFTGYATILKSSRFLRPAQQLLEEFCNMLGAKSLNMLEASNKVSPKITPSNEGVNAAESAAVALAGDSGGSSSTFFGSNEKMREPGSSSSPTESYKPEYLQKKAKLLYMQEEVCRRYKNYHQQMQMVVSSFETVAGLSSATPCLSLALKTVSRHFRSLRNAISDQLKNVRKALGEDLSSLTTGTSSNKGDTGSTRQKVIDQTAQKQRPVGGNIGLFEPQHVWRPQRGLPERAVAILRAWLFDHFLHPYPTDADKHMLATQTGLTRNQVSNWFINARVRVWKPMVEEIHSLESKGVAEASPGVGKTEGKAANEAGGQSNDSQALNRLSTSGLTDKPTECSEMVSSTFSGNRLPGEAWDQEKRSRLECRIPGSMDGSLVGFMPYQQSGIDLGGLGAVSLTLGLRQNADGMQQQHPMQQQSHENQLRRHFGDHIIYDFVG